MAVISPGDGARRSRRGYYFQDLCTVRCCFGLLDGTWSSITADGNEDIECVEASLAAPVEYVQVKTEEFPSRPWNVVQLCAAERPRQPETSILGRLFTGKRLPDGARFLLISNVQLHAELRPFVSPVTADRAPASATIAARLSSLPISDGRDVRWCVERLRIQHVAGDADALEAMVLRDLGTAATQLNFGLMPNELEALLEGLVAFVQRHARDMVPAPMSADAFRTEFAAQAQAAVAGTDALLGPTAPTLAEKLQAAGMDTDQVLALQDTHLRYLRTRRSALPDFAVLLDELTEEIRMRCISLRLERREGTIAPGGMLFTRTREAVEHVHSAGNWGARGVTLTLAYGALHDVTSRCQHRYD